MNFKKIERKWQERWMGERIFEAEVDEREKYFCNVPYPYMNGLLHLGRCFTILRVDVMARFKRMQGLNVLFPFAFHCTGTPIVAAAQRIKEGEEVQKRILMDMGIPASEISKFENPVFWTEYFPREAEIDLKEFGISVDWRRSFITTSLNPYYNKFIRWQFRKLKEKN
ncbi:MAG: class I tRNA ligase family protein, partial [Candidatus Methanofastidiosia archaeon]